MKSTVGNHVTNRVRGLSSRSRITRMRALTALLAGITALTAVALPATPVSAAAPLRPAITSATADALSYTVEFRLGAYSQPITQIEYSTDDGTTWAATEYICAARCTISITQTSGGDELTYGSSYPTKVKVYNADGNAASAMWPFQFITAPLPPVIGVITVTQGSMTVNFQQGNTGGAEITGIEYSTNGGTNWRSANCGTCSTATSILITATSTGTALSAGSSHSLQLRTRNRAGTSAPSATSNVTVGAVPTTSVLSTATGAADSIVVVATLGNSNGSPITIVEYSTDNGATWRTSGQATGTFTITETSATGGTLVTGTTYTIRIRTVNGAGTSPASNAKTAAPLDAPMPAVLESATGAANTIAVKLTAGLLLGGVLSRIEYSTDGGTSWTSTGGTATTFTITSPSSDRNKTLSQGTRYRVTVRVVTTGGTSGASNIIEAITGRAPGAPTIKTATRGDGAIVVTVTAGTDHGATPTRIEYSTDNGATWVTTNISVPAASSGSTTPGTTVPTLRIVTESNGDDPIADGTKYTLRVRLTNVVGTSSPSKAYDVTTGTGSGVTAPGTPTTSNPNPAPSTALTVGRTATLREFASLTGAPLTGTAKFTAVSKTPKICGVKNAKVTAKAAGTCRIWVKTTEQGAPVTKKLTGRITAG